MNEDFRLLSLQLDEHWSFRNHIEDAQKKMRVCMTILRRLSGLNWGLEARILAIAAHALPLDAAFPPCGTGSKCWRRYETTQELVDGATAIDWARTHAGEAQPGL